MKYLIFLDIDETIMTRGIIHPLTVSAVKRAKNDGHKIYINTGRAPSIIPKNIFSEIAPDGLVCGIGTYIMIDGSVERSHIMSKEQVRFLMDFSKRHSLRATIEGVNHSVSYCGLCFLGKDFEVFSYEDMYERFPNIDVSKFVFEHPLTEEQAAEISSHVNVFNHQTYSEANISGYSKSEGMDFVRKKLGYEQHQVIAMGDSVNDFDMLRDAGISVAMGNAVDSLKAIADFVTIPCSEGGVGYAIEKIIFNEH